MSLKNKYVFNIFTNANFKYQNTLISSFLGPNWEV